MNSLFHNSVFPHIASEQCRHLGMATNLHFCETREWLGAGQVGVVFQPCPLGFFFRTPMKMDTYLPMPFGILCECKLFSFF